MAEAGISGRRNNVLVARWRVLALGWGLLVGSSPLFADEWTPLRRLPPVSAQAPVSGQAVVRPEREPIELPENAPPLLDRYGGKYREASGPILRLPSISEITSPVGPSFGPSDGSIRLTSMLEPAVEAPPAPDLPEKPADDSKDDDATDSAQAKQDGQTPPTFGRKPESYALQFLRSQDVLLAPGAWQLDTGAVYTHFNRDFPVPVIDNGTGDVVDVLTGQVRRRLFYTPLAVRYGWSRNVQLFSTLPIGFSNTQISTVGSSDSTTIFGIGDMTSGASVHLLKAEDDLPDVIATMDFTAPTGAFSTPIFGLVPGSNLGQGFWAMSGSLLFIHRYDPIIVFYGTGYRHLFERTFNGALFSPGEQIAYQFGVGFSVNDRVTLSTAFQGFYLTTTQLNNQTVPGTNLEPMTVRFAATIARRCRIIEPFVAIGLTNSAPAANLGIIVTFY
jgi:hypothetical protein